MIKKFISIVIFMGFLASMEVKSQAFNVYRVGACCLEGSMVNAKHFSTLLEDKKWINNPDYSSSFAKESNPWNYIGLYEVRKSKKNNADVFIIVNEDSYYEFSNKNSQICFGDKCVTLKTINSGNGTEKYLLDEKSRIAVSFHEALEKYKPTGITRLDEVNAEIDKLKNKGVSSGATHEMCFLETERTALNNRISNKMTQWQNISIDDISFCQEYINNEKNFIILIKDRNGKGNLDIIVIIGNEDFFNYLVEAPENPNLRKYTIK